MRNRSNFLLHATFRKAVEKKKPEDVLSIDVNEKSIDITVVKRFPDHGTSKHF